MKCFEGAVDRRQRVSLSDEAFRIIESDRFTFASNDAISYSEIICRTFLQSVEQSVAMRGNIDKTNQLIAKKPSQTQTKTPSLRNDVLAYLSQPLIVAIINGAIFGGSPGRFIKAVIEEYAEKTFTERELIYFCDTVDKVNVNQSNDHKKLLRLVSGASSLFVKPYTIMSDKQSTYNYLIGYASANGTPGTYELTSLRISRIKNVTVLPDSDFHFVDEEINLIKQAVLEKGVQFLRGKLCEKLTVELTETGKHLYNALLFQRPEVQEIAGNTYTFCCTTAQADFYFFKFGEEAKVTAPQSLRDDFAKRYRRAAAVYEVGYEI